MQGTCLHVRSGSRYSKGFNSNNGVLQGDPCSPTLFNLFVHDLPGYLRHEGVLLDNKKVSYIMYADDLCLLGNSKEDLQKGLNDLQEYCLNNDLFVNIPKSKVIVFHKGRLPPCSFHYGDQAIERVNEFKYLGVTFSSQLSFSSHLRDINNRARAKIGFLFPTLNLPQLPLPLVLRVFQVYVLPVFEYALPVWNSGSIAKNTWNATNAIFTKYLKRYLGVPFSSNNAIIHFLTSTYPVEIWLKNVTVDRLSSLKVGSRFTGCRFTLLDNLIIPPIPNFVDSIPSYFWRSRMLFSIPLNPHVVPLSA